MKFEILCLECGGDSCYIDLYNTTDLSIDGDLIDGDGYYKITCLDCGSEYNSLDDYDCLAWE